MSISCSSHSPEGGAAPKETSGNVEINSAKIKGVTVSVGDRATKVYGQLGTGKSTSATNDPANPGSLITQHEYDSDGKIYRIDFCRTPDQQFDHVCSIIFVKNQKGLDSAAGQRENRQSLPNARQNMTGSMKRNQQVFTNDDLKKGGSK